MIRVGNLAESIEANPEMVPILLVPDDISENGLARLRSKYPEKTLLVSCFWFYFSVHYSL